MHHYPKYKCLDLKTSAG